MKIKNKLFIFLSVLAFAALLPQSVYAVTNCTPEQIEAGRNKLKQDCSSKLQEFQAALNSYNNAAMLYAADCGGLAVNVDQSMKNYRIGGDSPSGEAAGINQSYQNIISGKLDFTGIAWSAQSALETGCTQKIINAQQKRAELQDAFNNFQQSANVLDPQAELICVCADGNEDILACQAKNDANTEKEKNENEDKCLSVSSYLAEFSTCPFCQIFEVILTADNRISDVAWTKIAKPLISVVAAFFAVLLLLEALKFASNMARSNTSGLLKSILILGTKIAITIVLLSSSKPIYDYFINPVVDSGLDMGITLANQIGGGSYETTYSGSYGSGPISTTLLNKIMSTVSGFNVSAAKMPAIGMGLICNGWNNGGSFLPDFEMWFEGLITFVFGLMIWLAVSFYLIDCTTQLGITGALLPLFIACWPFKQTQRYTSIGAKMILNIFFDFVMMGVVLIVGAELMLTAIGGSSDLLTEAINSGNIALLKQLVAIQGKGILILIACGFFALKLLGKAGNLANMFSGGAGSKIGATMGGAVTSAAGSMVTGALKTGAKIAGTGTKALGKKLGNTTIGQAVTGKVNAAKSKINQVGSNVKSSIGEAVTGKSRKKGSGLPPSPPPNESDINSSSESENSGESGGYSPND